MKKLTPTEDKALTILCERGSICPGSEGSADALHEVRKILDGLVKKGRAVVEQTDDGPRYEPTYRGRCEAIAIEREQANA